MGAVKRCIPSGWTFKGYPHQHRCASHVRCNVLIGICVSIRSMPAERKLPNALSIRKLARSVACTCII